MGGAWWGRARDDPMQLSAFGKVKLKAEEWQLGQRGKYNSLMS